LAVVPAPNTAPKEVKAIDAGGNLVLTKTSSDRAGFRPGLQSLRSQKMHWTLTEMCEYDNMYTFYIKGKEPLFCASASLDLPSAQAFQQYAQVSGFKRPRVALLFGRFMDVEPEAESDDSKKSRRYGETKGTMRVSDLVQEDNQKAKKYVMVDCMYDPKQSVKDGNFSIDFEDEGIANARKVAAALGLQWVGIIFSHSADRTYHFSAHEILQSGIACLEATDGAVDSPFVIIKVAPNEEGIQMDAYQLTKTCLEMIKEEAVEIMPQEPAFFGVNERYQAIVEAKPALVIDTDFFIKRVPIKSHSSEIVNFGFPRVNREGSSQPNPQALKSAVAKYYSNTKSLRKAMKDFNLLLYLTQALGVETVVEIASDLVHSPEDAPIPEGFLLMVQEVASHGV
jgi:nuclear protein localization family protein 4